MTNSKPIRTVLFFLFPTLILLLCNGCRKAHFTIDALPFQENEKEGWGLISTDGQVKIVCGTFMHQPSTVVNGMFSLPVKEGYYQLYQIDHPEKPVSARQFVQIGHFFEEVTLARELPDSPIIIIDRKGKTINDIGISLHYDIVMAHNFSEGRALFCTREGKYGFMDTKGNIVIPPLYDQAYDFRDEVALVGKANANNEMSFQLIDWNGYICSTIQNTPILLDQQFGDGLLMYTNCTDGKCCYINKKGDTDIYLPDSIQYAYRFSYNAAIIQNNSGTGLINKRGEILIAPEYEDGFIAGRERACLKKDGQWRLYDFKGNPITSANQCYKQITRFYASGLAIVNQDNACAWIDRDGKFVDNKRYATIITDASALQQIPQVFIRRNSNKAEVANKVKTPDNVATGLFQTDRQPEPTTTSVNESKQVKHIEKQDWQNVSKKSPFYEEAKKILSGKLPETDAENRRVILNYVEHLRTSYTTKDIDFLTQLFSEDALIIVGTVVRKAPKIEGQYLSQKQVAYNVKSKRAYLERLKILFRKNKEINLKFSDFKILRHPTVEGLYGVTLRQKYSSDLYSDDGYLFLLWDFRDMTAPLIHVRTWQPGMLDDQTPLPEKEIFNIQNFNLQ